MKKRILAIALCAAMTLGLAACGGDSTSTAESSAASAGTASGSSDDSTVVIAMGSGFSTLDPGYVYEKYPPLIVNACYDNLFRFTSNDGEPEPNLVDTYEWSDDNLTLTCTLKDGLKFASGNPLTSADVAFSINRCKNLQGNPSFICETIDSIETPDDKTVIFHLNTVDSAFLSKLTYSSLAVLDSEVVKENGGTDAEDAATADTAQDYLNTASAGSGPYVMTSYTPDEEVVLEKNENYWGEASNVDKFIIEIQPDSNTQMMTLSSGDIDVAMNMTDDTMAELTDDNVVKINEPTKTVGFVMMNMDESVGGPVSNPDVQQAIRLALNYSEIQTICGEGSVTPYSLIQVGFMGSKGERSTDYTDIDKAKDLLAQAGYPDGFDIDLTVCDLDMEGIALTDLAQVVKENLAEIGINCNIVSDPWAAGYGDDYRDGKLGFTVMYWGTDYNDPNVQLEFLPGKTVGLRAGWTAEMDDQGLDDLYDQAMAATDNDQRSEILGQIQDAMYENGPFIFFAQAPSHIAYSSRIDGVAVSDPYALDVRSITIK